MNETSSFREISSSNFQAILEMWRARPSYFLLEELLFSLLRIVLVGPRNGKRRGVIFLVDSSVRYMETR